MATKINILNEIGQFGVSAESIINQLADAGSEDVLVSINSPGGDVAEGIAIYNALKAHPGNVTVQVIGMAASMASGIAMAGDNVVATPNAIFMVHNPQAFAGGDQGDMETAAKMLETVRDALAVAYSEKTGLSDRRIRALMEAETWMTAAEAEELGFVDEISDPQPVATAWKMPENMLVPLKIAASVTELFESSAVDDSTSVDSNKPDKEPPVATESKTQSKPDGPIPATVDQLEAMKGADDSFVVSQLKAKATVEQAQNALNEILVARLEAAEDEKNEAVEAARNESSQPQPEGGIGFDPIDNSTEGSEVTESRLDQFENLLENEMQRLGDPVKAYRAVNRKHPGLIESIREEANAAAE